MEHMAFLAFIFALLCCCRPIVGQSASEDYVYKVVVDAGTSGCKPKIFRWLWRESEPQIESLLDEKVEPGLQEFTDNIGDLDTYLRQVLQLAKDNVPEAHHAVTHFTFLATAGMRLITEDEADEIMDYVDVFLQNSINNPFDYQGARILSGEEEAVFSWMAVQYLSTISSQSQGSTEHSTIGILELGSGSTQIAFAPDVPILGGKMSVSILGQDHDVYGHSYVHYGQDLTSHWIREKLISMLSDSNDGAPIANPCMLLEDTATVTIEDTEYTFEGSGNASECEDLLDDFIYEVDPSLCHPKPCAIGSTYQPSIPSDMQFYALAAYVYTPGALGVASDDGQFVPSELQQSARTFCSQSLSDAEASTGQPPRFLSSYCLMGLYLPLLLNKGYGFDMDTTNIRTVSEINEVDPEWTLGAILYDNDGPALEGCSILSSNSVTIHSGRIMLTSLLFTLFTVYNFYFQNRFLHAV